MEKQKRKLANQKYVEQIWSKIRNMETEKSRGIFLNVRKITWKKGNQKQKKIKNQEQYFLRWENWKQKKGGMEL